MLSKNDTILKNLKVNETMLKNQTVFKNESDIKNETSKKPIDNLDIKFDNKSRNFQDTTTFGTTDFPDSKTIE